MNTSEIDSAILRAVGERWTKIAMVIARVVDAVRHDLPEHEGYEIISRRIEALVHDGRLIGSYGAWSAHLSSLQKISTAALNLVSISFFKIPENPRMIIDHHL